MVKGQRKMIVMYLSYFILETRGARGAMGARGARGANVFELIIKKKLSDVVWW
jgi:hypothetical protein